MLALSPRGSQGMQTGMASAGMSRAILCSSTSLKFDSVLHFVPLISSISYISSSQAMRLPLITLKNLYVFMFSVLSHMFWSSIKSIVKLSLKIVVMLKWATYLKSFQWFTSKYLFTAECILMIVIINVSKYWEYNQSVCIQQQMGL